MNIDLINLLIIIDTNEVLPRFNKVNINMKLFSGIWFITDYVTLHTGPERAGCGPGAGRARRPAVTPSDNSSSANLNLVINSVVELLPRILFN